MCIRDRGILIPVVIVFMRENMNTRVRGRKDLEGLSVTFIGEIPLSIRGKKRVKSVSYTHLDVYKRQTPHWHNSDAASYGRCSETE